jgi:hypothetical protein
MNKNVIIDFTFVEPTAKSFGVYNKSGQAALKGKENKLNVEYKHWNISGYQVENKFVVIAIETFGIIINNDMKNLFQIFINDKEDKVKVYETVLKQLSVAFHTLRAKQFVYIKSNIVSDGVQSQRVSQRSVRRSML